MLHHRSEICKSEIQEEVDKAQAAQDGKGSPLFGWPRRRLRALLYKLLDTAQSPSLAVLAFRLWRAYIFGAGLCRAFTSGMDGLRAGIKLGRSLVQEQSSAVAQVGPQACISLPTRMRFVHCVHVGACVSDKLADGIWGD